MERRSFLKLSAKLGITLAGFLTLPFFVSLKPGGIKEKRIEYFFLASLEEMPRKDVKKFELILEQSTSDQRLKNMNVYIVKTLDGWIALSPVCTHLGCMVNYNRIKKEFICPCHGGRYNTHGEVIVGPPSMPLTRLPLKVEDQSVFVGIKV
ncbi:MAG: Rieske 2Fe-2S domain-containing protein [Thermodesulfovibrionales bacterium]|nr:Rieske 2Fe-2S domain-containing protein [Thermodesulfovibrionales bacterium]